jgi:DNA adenine methylase
MAGRPTKNFDGIARPFVKWAGGKSQLLEELVSRLPEQFGTYHEPFVGGGALFFRLKELGRIRRARLSDVNPELMNAWKAIKETPHDVVAALERMSGRLGEEEYYRVRASDPAELIPAERAARVLYLNKTCFNGLYRENSKGKFNVPFGRYARPRVLDKPNLLAVSQSLQRVSLQTESFVRVYKHAKPGDLVYFDPPYHPLSKTSNFTSYARCGFGEPEQRVLAQLFAELAARGVWVLLSNSVCPLTEELYEGKGFEVWRIHASRKINSRVEGRGRIPELLVRAGGPEYAAKYQGKPRSDAQLAIDFRRALKVA